MDEGNERLVRAGSPTWITSRAGLDLVGPDARIQRLSGDTATLGEAILAFCERPRTAAEVLAHVEAESGAPLGDGARVVQALVDTLCAAGALVVARPEPALASGRVVVAMGGAVAAAHAPLFVQLLLARGIEVRVIATERAMRFVAKEALEALTHTPLLTSMWSGEGTRDQRECSAEPSRHNCVGPPSAGTPADPAPHVSLAAWADLVVVWPATATTIGRIANGDCSELVSAVAITTRAPVLVAPSMNEAMLDAVSVARNLDTLRRDRFLVAASGLAHEVAEAPADRKPIRGGAPDAPSLARMVEAILRTSLPEPRDAASWEAFHRRVPETEQAWATGDADPVVMEAIASHGAIGTLWDVGTGHGAIAIAAAARGAHVIASDVSDTALERAAARAVGARIAWVRDDVTRSAIRGSFDVIVDRGTLHTIPLDRRLDYTRHVSARTRPGTVVVVTTHTPPTDARLHAHPMTSDEVTALFGDGFERVAAIPGRFAGRLDPEPACVTTVLRRR